MKLESINSLSSVSLSNVMRARVSQGAISLPVNSAGSVYSNFKHIRGIPAANGKPGYSISRLRALDNLIDRLQGLKGSGYADEKVREASLLDETTDLEKFNENLKEELVTVLSNRLPGFLGSAEFDSGLFLNISV